jgi:hypothetical protein
MSFLIEPNEILSNEAIHGKDYLDILIPILKKTKFIKGTSAFWTLDYKSKGNTKLSQYSNLFYDLLRDENSYMCVDLHLPTNVEQITNSVNNGCNFYMFLFEVKADNIFSFNNNLLHSKVVLFEGLEFDYVLVGSHNQTAHAVTGLNMEFSFLMKIDPNSGAKKKILKYLDSIKELCMKLPISNLQRWMLDLVQKKGKLEGIENIDFIECACFNEKTMNSIKIGTLIHMISFNKKRVAQLSKLNDKICVSIQSKDGDNQKFWLVNIRKILDVNTEISKKSTAHTFEDRNYFYYGLYEPHSSITPTIIYPKKKLTSNYFRDSKFNYELEVIQEIQTFRKSNGVPTMIDPWKDSDENTPSDVQRFIKQFDSTQEDRFEGAMPKIRVLDLELIQRIFDSENESSFKAEEKKIIILRLGESIPVYNLTINYIELFKDIDEFISKNDSKLGRQRKENIVVKEFNRLYDAYRTKNEMVTVKKIDKQGTINSKHQFVNRGVAVLSKDL